MAVPVSRQYLRSGDAPPPRTLVDILRETAALHPDAMGIDDGEEQADLASSAAVPAMVIADSDLNRGPATGAPPCPRHTEFASTRLPIEQIGECGFI